jgi:hypothetical protein
MGIVLLEISKLFPEKLWKNSNISMQDCGFYQPTRFRIGGLSFMKKQV